MGKTTGQRLTSQEFASLRRGDVYFITDQNECRTFERHAKCYTNSKIKCEGARTKAVNSLGSVNPLADMRWPTLGELNAYERSQGLPQTGAPCAAAPARPAYTPPPAYAAPAPASRKETTMSTGKCSAVSQALTVVKADGVDAAWRTAAKQASRAVRAPLAALLGKSLPGGVVGLVLGQLDTEGGEALLSFVIGHTMSYVPQFSCDPKLMRLAKEMRVQGMSYFTDLLADAVLAPLREQLVEVVKLIPFGNEEG